MKYLIINADDFGYSKVFNKKILELIKENFVTSTSVMIDWINEEQSDQVEKLISLSKTHILSVGLHMDFKNTDFASEIQRQYDKFVEIFKFKPGFLDIHKSTYFKDGYKFIQEFCIANKLPCRNHGKYGDAFMLDGVLTTKYPVFSGTDNNLEEIEKWLESFENEYYQITFHPGYYDPNSKSSLNKEREADTEKIIKLNSMLEKYDVKLANYLDLVMSK